MIDKISTFISWILFGLLMVVGFKFLCFLISQYSIEKLGYTTIVLFFTFLIVEKLVSFYQEKQRTRKLKAIAIDMGLDFYQKGDEQIVPIVEDMEIFQGARPVIKNFLNDFGVIFCVLAKRVLPSFNIIISGIKTIKIRNIFKGRKQGCLFIICDLHTEKVEYNNASVVGHPGSENVSPQTITTSSQTTIVFISENLHLPEFRLTKQSKEDFLFTNILNPIANKIAKLIGKSLGYSQSQPQFSKLYNLQAREQIHYQRIFSDRIRAFYEAEQNLCTEAKGDRLICYRANMIVQPQQMQSFLETGFKALELFKEKMQETA